MSTRNPLNERYQTDERHGVTRKSASSAKPKTKAGATVYVKPTEKTPQEKKAARKAERARQDARQRKYYSPPTKRYKFLRRIWWALLAVAIVLTVVSWPLMGSLPAPLVYTLIGISYACIIGALVLEFTLVRKERNRYANMVENDKSKAARAAQKKAKAEERAQRAEAAEKFAAAKEAEASKPKGILGRLFGKKSQPTVTEEPANEADEGKQASK